MLAAVFRRQPLQSGDSEEEPGCARLESDGQATALRRPGQLHCRRRPGQDAGNPTYFPDSADPLYTLHCNRPWGTCEIEGHQIRVPAQALPAQGYATAEDDHDAHMTIVDQASGWEYDLWNVRSKPDAGGTLVFGWGGRTRIDGNGLGSGGTSAHFGNLAGIIRSEELLAGRIDHALVMGVPCSDSFVYPADNHGLPCRAAGLPSAHSWPTGSHFQLNVKPKKIKRWKIPRYRKAIAIALSRYGAYVSDTSGLATEWGFEIESGATYQSFGAEDGLTRLARALKLPPEDYNNNGIGEYWFNVDKGIKWSKLRIVAPCVARGAC